MENGQDTALGDGAVDDWEICETLGSCIKTRGKYPKPRTQALVNGLSKCAGR
jgi:hypothetical protein